MPDYTDPYRAYNFKLVIQGVTEGHFTECTGLSVEVKVIKYREAGNSQVVRCVPGPVQYGDVTLRYGLTNSRELWEWMQTAVKGKVQRKNASILMLNSDGIQEVMRWNLIDAWPSAWRGTPLDALNREAALRPALEEMASVLEVLWSEREDEAAQDVQSAVETLAHSLYQAAVAEEAVRAATETRAAAQILRSVRERGAAADAARARRAVRQAVLQARAATETAQLIVEPDVLAPIAEALEALREARAEELEEAVAAERVREALTALTSAADAIDAAEETATAEAIAAAQQASVPLQQAEGAPARAIGGAEAPEQVPARAHLGLGERLDQLAFRYYGNPALWRVLARFNAIDDPLHLSAGQPLRIPPASALTKP